SHTPGRGGTGTSGPGRPDPAPRARAGSPAGRAGAAPAGDAVRPARYRGRADRAGERAVPDPVGTTGFRATGRPDARARRAAFRDRVRPGRTHLCRVPVRAGPAPAARGPPGRLRTPRHDGAVTDEPIDLSAALASFDALWSPRIVTRVNDYDVRIAKVAGEHVWHVHDHTDEFFLVLDGELRIALREGAAEREVVLAKGAV